MRSEFDEVLLLVAREYHVPVASLHGRRRTNRAVEPRAVCFYLLRRHTDMSLPEIGRLFNRDHSTIASVIDTLQRRMLKYELLRNKVAQIESMLVSKDQLSLMFSDKAIEKLSDTETGEGSPTLGFYRKTHAAELERRFGSIPAQELKPPPWVMKKTDYSKPLSPSPNNSFDCEDCGKPYLGPNYKRCDQCLKKLQEPTFPGAGTPRRRRK